MNECEIVQDLLVGYNDRTLNNASKLMVEKHLKECEKCTKILEEIINDNNKSSDEIEIDYLKKVNKSYKSKNKIIGILVIIIVLWIALTIIAFVNYQLNYNNKMEIFLEDNITDEELENINNIIKSNDENCEMTYNSKEDALENFKANLDETDRKLLDGYNNENNIFPASIVITIKNTSLKEKIIGQLQNSQGIKKITYQEYNIGSSYYLLINQIYNK